MITVHNVCECLQVVGCDIFKSHMSKYTMYVLKVRGWKLFEALTAVWCDVLHIS